MTVSIDNLTRHWSNSAQTLIGIGLNVIDTGHAPDSKLFILKVNSNAVFSIDSTGTVTGNLNVVAANSDPTPAFNKANSAYDHANAAYNQANNASANLVPVYSYANASFYTIANGNAAFTKANLAYTQANAAYAAANNAVTDYSPAFNKANTAYDHANAAYAAANAASGSAAAFNKANTAYDHANAAYAAANNAVEAVKRGLYDNVLSSVPTQDSTGLTVWMNQSTSTVANTTSGITITTPSTISGYVSALRKSSSGINSITALVSVTTPIATGSYGAVMLGVSDGTKLEVMAFGPFEKSATFLSQQRWNSTSSYLLNTIEAKNFSVNAPIWLRIVFSGGNIDYQWSSDGLHFVSLISNSVTAFLANADYVFFGCGKSAASGNTYVTLLSWDQT